MSGRLPTSGSLKEFDLTEILREIYEEKITGRLVLQKDGAVKTIHFKDGHIVFASSSLKEDRLGDVLFRLGKLTSEQLRESIELIRSTGKQQGAILVEQGFLTAKELFEGLKDQVREIVYSLFLWEDGQFQLVQEELSRQVIPLQLDMVQLVSEILRRVQTED